MSWGFYCDVSVTLPTAALDRAWKSKTDAHDMASPIFGFRSAALEETFTVCRDHADRQPNVPLAALPRRCESTGGRSSTTRHGERTTFRGTLILDRAADPWIAKTAAALLHTARGIGEGYVLLVNDGSYAGEDGVLLRLSDHELTSTPILDCRPYVDRFARALFEGGELPTADEVLALSTTKPRATKQSPKKSAPKKSAPNESAPKKSAPPSPKGAAKKSSPKRT